MTECERIVNENILPKEFFDEEYICDFFVDKKRKKVWAIQIDLLLKLDKVCKEHNLRYFLIAGTLLGAVRHKGFIPWDDDIDVIMPRKDYDVLCKKGSEWFEKPYFLQTPESDKGYYFSFAKLRNSKTTALAYPHRYQNYNQGMGIDIFPLDKCKLETGEENYNRIKEMILENSNYMRNSNPHPSEDDKRRMKEKIAKDPMKNCKEINRIASQYEDEEVEYVGFPVCTVYHWEKECFRSEDFMETIEGLFHGYTFPIPKGYDAILTIEYGEYMVLPSEENRGERHNTTECDPDVPYLEYKKRIYGIESW